MATDTITLQNAETGFLARLFPRQIDNNFRGSRLALWLFGFFVLVKLAQGGESVFNAYATATNADGIPLASYGAAVAQTMVQMFALLGLNLMVLPLLGLVALVRYRAMVPLMYLMMLLLYLGNRVVHVLHPDAGDVGAMPMSKATWHSLHANRAVSPGCMGQGLIGCMDDLF